MIEAVVVASMSSAMLLLATGWIHQTMKQSTRFRSEHRRQQVLTQLSEDFRLSVWTSIDAQVINPDTVSLENSNGEQIVYKFNQRQLENSHYNSVGEITSIDTYRLPNAASVSFKLIEDSQVELRVTEAIDSHHMSKDNENKQRKNVLNISPTLGRWTPKADTSNSIGSSTSGKRNEESAK